MYIAIPIYTNIALIPDVAEGLKGSMWEVSGREMLACIISAMESMHLVLFKPLLPHKPSECCLTALCIICMAYLWCVSVDLVCFVSIERETSRWNDGMCRAMYVCMAQVYRPIQDICVTKLGVQQRNYGKNK